jgi:putative pyruvate formate lyase activating enzyme
MLQLAALGCKNVHLISPTQQLPPILVALGTARNRGLTLPVVYNTGGFERIEVVEALNGEVDIYLPDFKCWDEARATRHLRKEHRQ